MDNFISFLIIGLTLGGMYALIALGYTMVYGIIKLINFAHGDVLMVGAFVGYFFLNTLAFNALTPLVLYVPLTIGIAWWAVKSGKITLHKHTLMTIGALVLAIIIGALVPQSGTSRVTLVAAEHANALVATVANRDLGWRGLQLGVENGTLPGTATLTIKRSGVVLANVVDMAAPAALSLPETPLAFQPADAAKWPPLIGEYLFIPRGRMLACYIPWAALLILPIAMASGIRRMQLIVVSLGGGAILGTLTSFHFAFAFIAAMIVAAATGVAIERMAYKPLRTAPRIAALITAIGVSLFLENAGIMVWGERDKSFSDRNPTVGYLLAAGRSPHWRFGSVTIEAKEVIILALTVALMLALQYLVMKTRVGKAMRAVSLDRDAARLMGVDVDATISATFAIGSALAAAAGMLWGLYYNTLNPAMGIMPGIKAFTAAVLGGIGSIPGAMAGGLVMGVAENMVAGYLASSYRDAIAFAILIFILLVKPTGLFGTRSGEKV